MRGRASEVKKSGAPKTWPLVIAALVALLLDAALLADQSTQLIGVILPVAVLLVALLFVQPTLFVLLYIASRPLVDTAVEVQVGGVSLGTLWGAGLILVLGAYWVLEGFRGRVRIRGWSMPLGFLVAYAAFCFGRGDALYWFSNWVRLASFVGVAFTIQNVASTRKGQVMVVRAGTLLAVLQLAVIGLAVVQNRYGLAFYSNDVYDSLGQGPHGLASLAVLSSTFVWLGAMYSKSSRWPYVLLAALIGVAVALSLVRTTFLAFAIVALWFLWWSLRTRRAAAVAAAVAAFAGVTAVVYALQDMVLGRLADLVLLSNTGAAELAAGSGRLGIWQAVWQSATRTSASILLGQGANASLTATASTLIGAGPLWSHNDYLEFFITGGVVLAGLYVGLIAWMLVSTGSLVWNREQSSAARDAASLMTVVVVAFAVMAFFNGIAFYQASIGMAVVVGLARGMSSTPGETFLDDEAPADGA